MELNGLLESIVNITRKATMQYEKQDITKQSRSGL
jgi:hypothetical protein